MNGLLSGWSGFELEEVESWGVGGVPEGEVQKGVRGWWRSEGEWGEDGLGDGGGWGEGMK